MRDLINNVGRVVISGLLACNSLMAQPKDQTGDKQENLTSGGIELMLGDNSSTLDSLFNRKLSENMDIFSRNYITDGNEGVGYFGVLEGVYNIGKGLGGVVELQFPSGDKIKPRLGLQYFGKFDDFSLYSLVRLDPGDSNVTGEGVFKLSYSPGITENFNLDLSSESIVGFEDLGYAGSLHLFRLGVNKGDLKGGAALNLVHGKEGIDLNPGIYLATRL